MTRNKTAQPHNNKAAKHQNNTTTQLHNDKITKPHNWKSEGHEFWASRLHDVMSSRLQDVSQYWSQSFSQHWSQSVLTSISQSLFGRASLPGPSILTGFVPEVGFGNGWFASSDWPANKRERDVIFDPFLNPGTLYVLDSASCVFRYAKYFP